MFLTQPYRIILWTAKLANKTKNPALEDTWQRDSDLLDTKNL